MSKIALKRITLNNFGPFVGKHEVDLPETGLVLIKATVKETGDGSGAGKSFFLKAISRLTGGCQDPNTSLQSWYTDEPPESSIVLQKEGQDITLAYKKGLSVKSSSYKEIIKGKAAAQEIDNIFGLDEKTRGLCTYRGQGERGMFLSQSDEDKKKFVWQLLDVQKYEKLEQEGEVKIALLEKELQEASAKMENARSQMTQLELSYKAAQEDLNKVLEHPVDLEDKQKQVEAIQAQIDNYTKQLEPAKKAFAAEKDAVLQLIQGKIKDALRLPMPMEIQAIKTLVDELRNKAKEIEKADHQKLLDVEKQRAQVKSDFEKQSSLLRIESEKTSSKLKVEIATLSSKLAQKPKLEKALAAENAKIASLQAQVCDQCKRQWIGQDQEASLSASIKKANELSLEIEGLQEVPLNHAKTSLSAAVGDLDTKLASLSKEYEARQAAIANPCPSPAYFEIQNQVAALIEKGRAAQQEFEAARQQKVRELEKEELAARSHFNGESLPPEIAKLDTSLTEARMRIIFAREELKEATAKDSEVKFKKFVAEDRLRNYQASVEAFSQTDTKCQETLDSLNLEKDLVDLVGRRGFLGAIVDEVLVEVAQVANDILQRVANVRHLSVDFETEKVSLKGNATARIVPVVYCRGAKVPFKCGISGGMQTSVELAVDLAMGDVISRRRGTYPGWLILDESFDGLGGASKESCIEMLSAFAQDRLILVVDHDASFQGLFHQVIEIESVDGKSRIL